MFFSVSVGIWRRYPLHDHVHLEEAEHHPFTSSYHHPFIPQFTELSPFNISIMDDSGPSRSRRSSDPLLSAHDRAPKLHLLSTTHDDIPPPRYSEAPRAIFEDMVDAETRNVLLDDPDGDGDGGSPSKRGGDGLEVGREEIRTESMEQRKALWWRSVMINALFISSWSVSRHRQRPRSWV